MSERSSFETVAFVLFVGMLAGVVGLVAGRRMTRPLAELARTAEQLGAGDLSHRFVSDSLEEIAHLAQSLNRMAGNLTMEIAERQRVEEHLHRSREQFRDLSAHLQIAREEERTRIARDIHDDLGQCLTTLKLDLDLLCQDTPESATQLRGRIIDMSNMVDGTIRSVRRIIAELRPRLLDDLGLTAAIEWQTADFQKRTGIPVSLSIYPPEIILDRERSTAVFRIYQEALVNVARHARATAVDVSLTDIDGKVEFRIHDNGRGITSAESEHARSFGLMGIRERADSIGGTAVVSGIPHEGTLVAITFATTDEEPRE
jgi:signal transduction histidine kinase